MGIVTESVLTEVGDERKRQDDRWGEQNHSLPVYYTILAEEVGEVAKAILEHRFGSIRGNLEEVREELIQSAAVAVAMVERIDRAVEKKEVLDG